MNQKFLCDFYRMTGKKFKRNIKSYLLNQHKETRQPEIRLFFYVTAIINGNTLNIHKIIMENN